MHKRCGAVCTLLYCVVRPRRSRAPSSSPFFLFFFCFLPLPSPHDFLTALTTAAAHCVHSWIAVAADRPHAAAKATRSGYPHLSPHLDVGISSLTLNLVMRVPKVSFSKSLCYSPHPEGTIVVQQQARPPTDHWPPRCRREPNKLIPVTAGDLLSPRLKQGVRSRLALVLRGPVNIAPLVMLTLTTTTA